MQGRRRARGTGSTGQEEHAKITRGSRHARGRVWTSAIAVGDPDAEVGRYERAEGVQRCGTDRARERNTWDAEMYAGGRAQAVIWMLGGQRRTTRRSGGIGGPGQRHERAAASHEAPDTKRGCDWRAGAPDLRVWWLRVVEPPP
jgi:hypothetical protein